MRPEVGVFLTAGIPVGVGGLEPPTSASQTQRASRLRYTPATKSIIRFIIKRQGERMTRAYSTIKHILPLMFIYALLAACTPLELTPAMPVNHTPAGWVIITPALKPTATPTMAPNPTAPIEPTLEENPTVTSPPPEGCQETNGVVQLDSFDSQLLKKAFEFRVYLPPCYATDPAQRYPVLYLLHGLGYNDDQWERLGVAEMADALINTGELAPLLIVMPREPNFYPYDRSNYEEIFLDELIPRVDGHYASLTERQYRAIGGLSRGAAWAMRIGIDNWQEFAAIGAHSPPISDLENYQFIRTLREIPMAEQPRIFIDIGHKDRELTSAQAFENALTEANLPHVWYLFEGQHTEAYWQAHLEIYLRWYGESWYSSSNLDEHQVGK